MGQISNHTDNKVVSVSLKGMLSAIIDNYKRIALITTVFIIVGVLLSFIIPVEYSSEVKLMPELQRKTAASLRRFSDLIDMAGIDMGSASGSVEAIRPDLYPNVIHSTPFIIYLLYRPVVDVKNRKFSRLYDFLIEKDKGLFSTKKKEKIPVLNKENEPIALTKGQEEFIKSVQERINAGLDKKSGIISVYAEMPDPRVAALVVNEAVNYLKQYVEDYRTGKARKEADFLFDRLAEARRRYQSAEYALSVYRDQHKYIVTQLADIEGRRLQANLSFTESLYNELNRQYEQARLRVQEETPVYKVLEPAQIPTKRSQPKRTLIVLGFLIVGFVLSIAFVLFSNRRSFIVSE